MTRQQKIIIVVLAAIVLVLFIFGCAAVVYLQLSLPNSDSPEIATLPTPTLQTASTPTATSTPVLDVAPTQTPLPTLTNTRVVQETTTPTPTPTTINCINNIVDFEASGVVSNEQVEDYLRQTLPPPHLNRCLKIRYVDRVTETYSTPTAGRFIPVIRHISVYPIAGFSLTPKDIFDTLVHEVGHNVHYNMRIDDLEMAQEWGLLYRQDAGFVSDYARTNEYEDFAETYRYYVREPEILILHSPIKYEFMRVEVFDAYEYAP